MIPRGSNEHGLSDTYMLVIQIGVEGGDLHGSVGSRPSATRRYVRFGEPVIHGSVDAIHASNSRLFSSQRRGSRYCGSSRGSSFD